MDRFHITPPQLLVVCDDLDLQLGSMRIRARGSAGGQKGMLDVSEALGTQDFPRLRVGIGRPPPGLDEVPYVLGVFTRSEEAVMAEVRPRVAEAVKSILTQGLDAAMNLFNQRGAGSQPAS